MSNQVTGVGGDGGFGANSWLVDELYEQFKKDRNSVDKEWWPILEQYTPDAAAQPAATPAASAQPAHPVTAPIPVIGAQPVARTTAKPAKQAPIPAQAPKREAKDEAPAEEETVTPLRGMPKTLAAN